MDYRIFEKQSRRRGRNITLIFGILWVLWWSFLCRYGTIVDTYFPFGEGFNPPSISYMVLGLLILPLIFGICTYLQYFKYLCWIVNIFAGIGKNSLYIFMYHMLFRKVFMELFVIENVWMERLLCFSLMIVGSILIGMLIEGGFTQSKKVWKRILDENKLNI